MRKLASSHGLYRCLPELLSGKRVRHQGHTFQMDSKRDFIYEMRFDSYPTLFGTGYDWMYDYPVYQVIGKDIFYFQSEDRQ